MADVESSVKSLDELIEAITKSKKDWFHTLPAGVGTPIKVEFGGQCTVLYVHAIKRSSDGDANDFALLLKPVSVEPIPPIPKEDYDPTQN